ISFPLISFREPGDLPEADVCIFDRVRLALQLYGHRPEPLIHFCQGFERTDLEIRLADLNARRGWLQGFSWRMAYHKRQRQIDAAYRLPTIKYVTHRHLADSIQRYYGQPSTFVPLGLPEGIFAPGKVSGHGASTILVVGPLSTGWKRIADAL